MLLLLLWVFCVLCLALFPRVRFPLSISHSKSNETRIVNCQSAIVIVIVLKAVDVIKIESALSHTLSRSPTLVRTSLSASLTLRLLPLLTVCACGLLRVWLCVCVCVFNKALLLLCCCFVLCRLLQYGTASAEQESRQRCCCCFCFELDQQEDQQHTALFADYIVVAVVSLFCCCYCYCCSVLFCCLWLFGQRPLSFCFGHTIAAIVAAIKGKDTRGSAASGT